jgi:hypothetical protein
MATLMRDVISMPSPFMPHQCEMSKAFFFILLSPSLQGDNIMTNFSGIAKVNFETRQHIIPILHFSYVGIIENACYF